MAAEKGCGGIVKLRRKISKKRQKTGSILPHNENTTVVTYLKPMSFGSVSSIPFTVPARFFISSPVRVVEVRWLVMVGWFMRTVCHQIVRIRRLHNT